MLKTRENKIDTEIFLASLYNRHMRYTEAEEILRPILAKNKRDVEGNYELGYSLFKQERYEEALEYFLKTYYHQTDHPAGLGREAPLS